MLGLLCATGLLMMYLGMTTPQRPRTNRTWHRLEHLVAEAGSQGASATKAVAASILLLVLVFVAVSGLTTSAVVGAVFGLLGAWIPWSWLAGRRRRRLRALREGWPDVIASLIASIRAGVSLPEALLYQRSRVSPALKPSFEAFASAYRASGSFPVGLEALRVVAADPVADRVVVALEITHEVGGTDVVRTLRTIGDFVRMDLRTRAEVEARWSWTIVAARVASAAPWVVLLMMSTRPEAARVYSSSTGVAVIVFGAVSTFAGYRLMLRAARLPSERRLAR